jgi:hypothetical protein
MQCIDGQNLRTWIQSDGHRPLAIVIRILSRIAGALIAAHTLGLSYGNLSRPTSSSGGIADRHRLRYADVDRLHLRSAMRRDEPFDEVFRDRVYAAWREVLRPGVEYMKGKY